MLVRALCGGDWTKAEFYLQSTFDTFMYLLLIDKEANEYQERLMKARHEAQERKQKMKSK